MNCTCELSVLTPWVSVIWVTKRKEVLLMRYHFNNHTVKKVIQMTVLLVMKTVSFLSANNSIQFMTYMARNVSTSIPTFFA